MQKYQNNIAARNGDAVVGIKVLIKLAGTATPATIYSDDGVTTTPNPLTTNANGYFEFYAANGRYDIYVNGAQAYTDVLIADALGIDADALKKAEAAAADGATKVGTPEGTVQEALNIRPTNSELALPEASNGLGTVQPVSGALARTQGNKNTDVLSLRDFIESDVSLAANTLAMQAALAAALILGVPLDCNGMTMDMGALQVPAGVEIRGSGANFDFSTAGAITGFLCESGVKISGFAEIKGPGNTTYQANSRAIAALGVENAAAAPTYIIGPDIRSNVFRGWGAYGVYMEYCSAPVVLYNEFYDIGYAPVAGLSCTDGNADYNVIEGVGPGTSSNTYGIFWSRKSTLSELEQPRSKDCTANYNKLKDLPIWEGIDTHAGVNIQVIGNTFENVKTPVAFVASSVAGVESLAAKYCKAAHNHVVGATGVAFSIAGAVNGGSVVEYALGCEVFSNTTTSGGIAGNSNSGVVRAVATDGLQVQNNFLDKGGPFGVALISDNKNFNVTGGTIRDMSDASVTTAGGVAVRSNNNTGFIGGITFVRENTALTNVMVNSIVVTPATTGNVIAYGPCQFVGDTSAALAVSVPVALPDCAPNGVAVASGSGTVALVSAATSNLLDVTFSRPLPAIPKVIPARTSAPTVGGKTPDLQITNESRTGFRIIARPADATSWSSSGSLTFTWRAIV